MFSLLLQVIAMVTVATYAAAASSESSVWNSDGDLVLSPAVNKSVQTTAPLYVRNDRVLTEADVLTAIAPIMARISALETRVAAPCVSQPCANGATCSVSNDMALCSCTAGFTGTHCDLHLDRCASSPCLNGGSCSESAVGMYHCECTSEFDGVDCQREAAFISVWETTSDGASVSLPMMASGVYNFTVTWGDEGIEESITGYATSLRTHQYALKGNHTVTIRGDFVGFRFGDAGDKERLREIQQWGRMRVGDHASGGYFYGCSNLVITATDPLDLTGTTTLAHMFRDSGIDYRGGLTQWDTKNITDMSYMFWGALSFDQPLSFNTSNVQNMYAMFHTAHSFNSPIEFDTSSVTDMRFMFYNAETFNQQVSFDTSSVSEMYAIFSGALAFNQSLSSFDTSLVSDMRFLFSGASSFNQPLSLNTSNVIVMNEMFHAATAFNQPLPFDTSRVSQMLLMFDGAKSFNQDLSEWCVSLIPTQPTLFDDGTPAWTLPRPVWGSCP